MIFREYFFIVLPERLQVLSKAKKIVMPEIPHNVIASDSAAIPAESNKPRSPRRSLSLPPRDDIIIFRGDIVFFIVILRSDLRIKQKKPIRYFPFRLNQKNIII